MMFKSLCFLALLLATVSALVIPRQVQPQGWDVNALEPYPDYHARYLALDCESNHGNPFFAECCHPLLANETLASRPPQCTPSPAAEASASAAESTSTVTTPGGDGGSKSSSTVSSTPTSAPTGPVANPAADPQPETPPSPSPSPSSSPSGSGTTFTGSGTFYFQNGVAGACGVVNPDSAPIVAIDSQRYGDTTVVSPLCGKQVHITNTANSKSVVATIMDACPTCNTKDSIDMSVGTFTQIADEATGLINISWFFV